MEDTLRYFFSAVFQGFAAIITLGIMFYLYYLDKLSNEIKKAEHGLENYIPKTGKSVEERELYYKEGFFPYMKKYVLTKITDNPSFTIERQKISRYDSIQEQKESLSTQFKYLFKIARVILIVSLISLFIIGYVKILDYVLLISGATCIILSIIFFTKLFTFSKQIIDNPL